MKIKATFPITSKKKTVVRAVRMNAIPVLLQRKVKQTITHDNKVEFIMDDMSQSQVEKLERKMSMYQALMMNMFNKGIKHMPKKFNIKDEDKERFDNVMYNVPKVEILRG